MITVLSVCGLDVCIAPSKKLVSFERSEGTIEWHKDRMVFTMCRQRFSYTSNFPLAHSTIEKSADEARETQIIARRGSRVALFNMSLMIFPLFGFEFK